LPVVTRRAFVRVRPTSGSSVWEIEGGDTIRQVGSEKQASYTVDRVFDASQSNEALYRETTMHLVRQVVEEGLNATVLAYGQTSSGKTHTMRGSLDDPGVIPRAAVDLIRFVQAKVDAEPFACSVMVSYMEIYNEEIRDLLAEAQISLAIGSGADGGVVVQGLSERAVDSVEEVMALLDKGDAVRRVGETRMNARSSRSHAIFRLTLGLDAGRRRELTLVDLAGSERLGKTGAEGQRQKEGAAINKSLLVLGTVISKLSNAALGATRGMHVPYRDSKLTRVLQPALGGNSKTAIICAITPAAEQTDESHNSLAFACRAKDVLNEVRPAGNHGAPDVDGEGALVMDAEALQGVVKRKVERVTRYMMFESSAGRGGQGGSRRQSWSGISAEHDLGLGPKRARRVTCSSLEATDTCLSCFEMPSDGVGASSMGAPLDAMSVLERYKRDLEAVRGELKRVTQSKGDVLPALKEAQWRNRQLEKDLEMYKAEAERYKKLAIDAEPLGATVSGGANGSADDAPSPGDTADAAEIVSNYEAQIAELQACADAASAHVRYLEDKADQETREKETAIAELETRHAQMLQSMEKSLRDLEDTCERSKLEIDALQSDRQALKEENDGLLKRIGLASGTLNALDELRDLKAKHRDEVSKLNAQIRSLTVGSKGNERAADRAAKDTNRLKSQILDLEVKLKKAISEKSALQSEKAMLDREYRTAKASLEKLNKTVERASAAEERRRQPIIKELEETKSKLISANEETNLAKASAEKEAERAGELQQSLEASRAEAAELVAALEAERETTADLSSALKAESENAKFLAAELEDRSSELKETSVSLQEANRNVAKLNESLKSLKASVEQGSADRSLLETSLETIKQEKQILEDSLEAAETKAEMIEGLQLDLDAERAQVAALQKNFGVMEKGLEDHKREVEVLKKTIAEKEEYASSLDGSVNESTKRVTELQAALEAAGIDIRKTKSLLTQAENAIEEHETTITEIHREKLEVEKAMGELEKEAEELRRDQETWVEERSALDGRIQTLQDELHAAQKAVEAEVFCGNTKVDDLMAAHEAALYLKDQELEEARSAREKLDLEVSSLRADILDHEVAVEKLRNEQRAEADTAEAAATRMAQELQSSFDQLRAVQKELEAERAASKSAMEQLRETTDQAANMAEEAAKTRQSASASHRELLAAQAVVSGLEEEIRALRTAKDSSERTVGAMEEKMRVAQDELLRLQHELEAARVKADPSPVATNDVRVTDLDRMKERYAILEGELRKSKRREEKLQALQFRLQMDVKESGGSVDALKNLRSVRELEFDLDRAQNQISRLRAQVDKAGRTRPPLEPIG
jgi:centromeric protein E